MDDDNKKNLQVYMQFMGANDGVVTGSATIVKVVRNGITRNILIDYGLFQGEDYGLNFSRFIPSDEIDAVILTHAHLDHCGGVPYLFKTRRDVQPFSGKIYCSYETMRQSILIMKDTAKIHEKAFGEENTLLRKELNWYYLEKERLIREKAKLSDISAIDEAITSLEDRVDELYFMEDVNLAIPHFEPISVKRDGSEEFSLFEGIDAVFEPTPHINGACLVKLICHLGPERYTIVFTGDIGKNETILYRRMLHAKDYGVNAIVMESLHGNDFEEETLSQSTLRLKTIIRDCIRKHKVVIIPSFAMDRSAGVYKITNDFRAQGMKFNVYFDTPLGAKMLSLYMEDYNKRDSAWFKYLNGNPFRLDNVQFVTDYQDHLITLKHKEPGVYITSAGMGNGGRVLDYFREYIQNDKAVFVFPGFLCEGTPARTLVEAQKGEIVEIMGERYKKRCETVWLHGFSSHGYIGEKIELLETYPNAQMIYLNHGDKTSIKETSDNILAYNQYLRNNYHSTYVPEMGEVVRLY